MPLGRSGLGSGLIVAEFGHPNTRIPPNTEHASVGIWLGGGAGFIVFSKGEGVAPRGCDSSNAAWCFPVQCVRLRCVPMDFEFGWLVSFARLKPDRSNGVSIRCDTITVAQ